MIELLVAAALGLTVVLAAIQLLGTHARVALQVQADLAASATAAWALRSALRDVRTAGGDPRGVGLDAFAAAGPDVLEVHHDGNGDGRIDPGSEEKVRLRWRPSNGGRLSRQVGRQSMAIASRVPPDGLRFRYFDARGREIDPGGGLDDEARRLIRRVEVDLEVEERLGAISGHSTLHGAASVRVLEGRP